MAEAGPVLLVEDEYLVLESTADLLRDAGMEVLLASDSNGAMAQLEERPDVAAVVTDIQLARIPTGYS